VFEKIVGNEQNKIILEDSIKKHNFVNSYMFVGNEGIGKEKFAEEFAKNIMCLKDGNCNDTCESCIKFEARTNPDFIKLDKNEKGIISIEMIRSLQDEIIKKPIISDHKVCIINDADLMNESAQNCFLKTLEEPPKYMVIILIVSNESKMLQTIKSRCVKINFKKLSDNEIKKILTNADAETLTMLDGSMANIENLDKRREEYEQLKNLISDLKNCSMAEIFNKADLLYNKKDDIMELLNLTNIILFDERLYDGCEIVEKTKVKIDNNNNYTMCIDYLLMNLYDIINKTR